MNLTLIDAGPIFAYFCADDHWHQKMREFLETFKGQFVTTAPVITEVMWLLGTKTAVQNELLSDIAKELYIIEPLIPQDFARIKELNTKYSDVKADFADLSLITISERLGLEKIVSFDGDFDIYRGLRNKSFKRIFPR